MAAQSTNGICVFSPGLRLTVTAEDGPTGDEIHLHPGGQGYWLARSIERLGEPVVLCATVGGEVGDVLAPLLRSQTGIELIAVHQAAPSSVSMYDRRSGTRTLIARSEPGPIDRHAVDELYSLTLAHAIGRGCCVLAGNIDTGIIPPPTTAVSAPTWRQSAYRSSPISTAGSSAKSWTAPPSASSR